MFNIFKASNPDRGFRNVIQSSLAENPELIIAKAELEDFNNKTKVRVNFGECAVFLVNGQIVQILGPSTESVEVANYPFFSNFKAMFYHGTRANACSVYFMRTGECQTPLLWGTPGAMPFVDASMGNSRFFVGAGGTFNVTVDIDNAARFFAYASMGANITFSYEQLSLKLQADIARHFRDTIKQDMEREKCYDTPDQSDIAVKINATLAPSLREECGLILTKFSVDNLMLEDSPERTRYRTMRVDKDEREQNQDLDDRGERKAILRKAMEEEIIREAAAKGKLRELEQLGDNFWKVKIPELAEIALSNPSIANVGASALGGYLGTHTDILSGLIGSLGDLMGGAGSNPQPNTQPQAPAPEMSSDFWGAPATSPDSDATVSPAPAPENDSTKLNLVKTYTQLLVAGKISQEQYDKLINDL